MLVIALAELPQMAKGKGDKIINIPTPKLKSGEEWLSAVELVRAGEKLTVYAGSKYKTMTENEIDEHADERGKRGLKLPRGFQKVDKLEVVGKNPGGQS
jgi:topoisomerase-4 subunit A